MYYAESKELFETTSDLRVDNNLSMRLLCVKDFLKKCALLPFALLLKAGKTFFRVFGLTLAATLVLLTLGCSGKNRIFFVERIRSLAADIADWLFYPLALLGRLVRFVAGLAIHPSFYFNSVV